MRTLILGMLLALTSRRPAFLTEAHAALIALPGPGQAWLGVTEEWKHGPHQLTCRQAEYTFGLVARALAKDQPDGAPSGQLAGVCDDLLEASIPARHKDASTALAVDWADVETFARPPRHGSTECADPEAAWGHRNLQPPRPQGRDVLRLLRPARSPRPPAQHASLDNPALVTLSTARGPLRCSGKLGAGPGRKHSGRPRVR